MILEVENLRVKYDKAEVLKNVNIKIREGEIASLIGQNGSGKSTLFKAICGLIRPVKGVIRFLGGNIEQSDAEAILRQGIGYVPQGHRVFPSLTVDENLDIGAYLLHSARLIRDRKEELYAKFPMLTDKAKDLAAHLSGGQQQILGFARALILSPKLLLLDEPSLGVDPKTLDIILETVMQLKCEGVTIFVIEQNVRAALSIADRVYFLKDGEIVAEDSPLDIEEKLDFLLWNPLSPGPPSLG